MTTFAQTAKTGAAKVTVAPTPPMGWNSWDAYGLTITEEQFRADVNVLAHKLKPFGWRYAVIDEGWFMENPLDRPKPELLKLLVDGNGRYIPVPARFPSSVNSSGQNDGFKALGEWVHAQGLKFGIHIVRGIPRIAVAQNLPVEGSNFKAVDAADQTDACPWDPTNWGVRNNAAGQAWYDSLLRQYAGWGVDLIKVDCISSHPYKIDEIRMIRRAIDKSGRPMVLSLSPGPTALENAAEVAATAQMWRISDDIWDYWSNPKPWPRSVLSQFETTAAWAKYAKPGNWPDADMLPLGELRPVPGDGQPRTSRLTPDEQKTMLTLWAMARSPLILGANLTLLDDSTLKLLTNKEVIRIDQTSTGSRQVSRDGDVIAWTSDLADGSHALALFNVGDAPIEVKKDFAAYGFTAKSYKARDAWTGQDLGTLMAIGGVSLPPHASVLWVLRK
jgi:hypothetical protein